MGIKTKPPPVRKGSKQGAKPKKTNVRGKPYDNFNLYCADYESQNKSLIFGPDFELLKIKAENFLTALGRNVAALNKPEIKTVKDIEGLLIVPVYDKFGNCNDFTLSLGEGAPKK